MCFSFSFAILFILGNFLKESYARLSENVIMSQMEKKFNKKPVNLRKVFSEDIKDSPSKLKFNIVFVDKKNPDGSMKVKFLVFDTFQEGIFPMLILLSLVIASPIKINIKLTLAIASLLIYFYITYLKAILFLYDNYSAPEYLLLELDGFIGLLVYNLNMFYSGTGFSSNLILPILIWLLMMLISGNFSTILIWDKNDK